MQTPALKEPLVLHVENDKNNDTTYRLLHVVLHNVLSCNNITSYTVTSKNTNNFSSNHKHLWTEQQPITINTENKNKQLLN